jgi:CRISPR-associated protein Cst1
MLELTGFVLPDVGILTITALVGKFDPAQVTRDDLDYAADVLEAFYSQGIGKSLAAGVVFPNSGFVQSEYDKPQFQYKRKAWANFVLRGHQQLDLEPTLAALDKKEYRAMVVRGDQNAPHCIFTGSPAYLRVSRDMLPMINGRGVGNFSPMGEAGLPISDVMLLAIHALPLGCIITQGALLAIDSESSALMFAFVRENLHKNHQFIHLASQNGYEKFPNLSSYKTRLIDVLVSAYQDAVLEGDEFRSPSLTAYHFSNNGTSARVTIYPLPSSTVSFVWTASSRYASAWNQIIARAWTQDKPESEELQNPTPKITRRNLIYEDLFDLPEDARTFLRTYFLRHPLKAFKRDPRAEYNVISEADLISWDLTALFLKGMLNMEKRRIDHIRDLGDRLAQHIQEENDRKLLRTIYAESKYFKFRLALLRAMFNYKGRDPLVTLEGFTEVFQPFEESPGFGKQDWNLARDLLLIRIFEQLHKSGFLAAASEDLQIEEDERTGIAD